MKKLIYIATAICLALLIGGAVLTGLLLADDETVKNVTLEKDGETLTNLSFSVSDIHPSESRAYSVVLHGGESESLLVTLTFDDVSGALADFVEIDVKCDGFELHSALRNAEGQEYRFGCAFSKTFTITVTYSIPAQVGNEAMGEQADFCLRLQADRQ